jgi:hypothetical protein
MRGVTVAAAAAEAPAVVGVAAGRDTRLLHLLEVRCEVAAVLLRSGCVVLLLLMLGHSVRAAGVMRVATTVLLAATSALLARTKRRRGRLEVVAVVYTATVPVALERARAAKVAIVVTTTAAAVLLLLLLPHVG